ncbi:MAG TPA: hypothetical protein P5081_01340 [Phycisphaerae bacterium]|nr:hypothetical protein [Phycisphaerae bacterium]HRW51498.1 hypothetical protein [Phycisphaerae bacterium]
MDIENPKILKLKGVLFLLLGSLAAAILLVRSPAWETAALLVLTTWAFCRFYYFAFYVLHEYADPDFKYAGLWDLSLYLIGWRKDRPRREPIRRSEHAELATTGTSSPEARSLDLEHRSCGDEHRP